MGATESGEMQVYLHTGGGGGFYFSNRGLKAEGSLMVFGLPEGLEEELAAQEAAVMKLEEQIAGLELDLEEAQVQAEVPAAGISPVSYVVIGIGVVLVIIAGVLFTRRRST